MKIPIGEGPISSKMLRLVASVVIFNQGNMDYHQSAAERHPNLGLKFACMKDLDGVDPFNISGVDRGK